MRIDILLLLNLCKPLENPARGVHENLRKPVSIVRHVVIDNIFISENLVVKDEGICSYRFILLLFYMMSEPVRISENTVKEGLATTLKYSSFQSSGPIFFTSLGINNQESTLFPINTIVTLKKGDFPIKHNNLNEDVYTFEYNDDKNKRITKKVIIIGYESGYCEDKSHECTIDVKEIKEGGNKTRVRKSKKTRKTRKHRRR
jgi:hypothetical protein